MLTACTISKPKSTDGRAVNRLIPYKNRAYSQDRQSCSIDVKRSMGGEAEAVTILRVFEKANAIRSPGAYLRRLTQMGRDGVFSLQSMLMALANREIVS